MKASLGKFTIVLIIIACVFLLEKNFAKKEKETKQVAAQQLSLSKTEDVPNWRKVQELAKDTVVQLFVQASSFNWREPFKSPEQNDFYGTAFFINAQGDLLSNFHVVNEAESIKMQVPSLGKQRFDVKVVGVCPERDVALLRLSYKDRKTVEKELGKIPFLTLGDSDTVFRTQQVLALGYPLGQEKLKSTQGIVSGREDLGGNAYIQTTAPVNPGNSGGPSLDATGKVIGINTASISSAQNVGYIVPVNEIKNIIHELSKKKLLRLPELGFEKSLGTKELVSFLKNPEPGGVYVSRVYKNGLLARAGIQEGDMIYAINKHKVDLYEEVYVPWSEEKIHLRGLVSRFELNQKVEVEFYRKGEDHKVNFNFSLVDSLPIRYFYPEYEKIDYEIIGGMVVMELALNHMPLFEEFVPTLIKYKEVQNQYTSRLIITHILHSSQANQARAFDAGEIIDEVNGKKVLSLADFRAAVKRNNTFLTVKSRSKKFMALDLEKVLQDEAMLAERNFYKESPLIANLKIMLKKSVK